MPSCVGDFEPLSCPKDQFLNCKQTMFFAGVLYHLSTDIKVSSNIGVVAHKQTRNIASTSLDNGNCNSPFNIQLFQITLSGSKLKDKTERQYG